MKYRVPSANVGIDVSLRTEGPIIVHTILHDKSKEAKGTYVYTQRYTHLLSPNLLPRMTWTLSRDTHSTRRGTVARQRPSFNQHTHTHTHTEKLMQNTLRVTSFGCCRMTTRVSIETGDSGKQLQTHTTLGRLQE